MKKFIKFIGKRFGFEPELDTNERLELKAEINLIDIERSFEHKNVKLGDVVLHKNGFVYKIVKFGLVQIKDRWHKSVIYVDFENDDVDLTFTREWSDFTKSFKKVEFIDDIYVEAKGAKDETDI